MTRIVACLLLVMVGLKPAGPLDGLTTVVSARTIAPQLSTPSKYRRCPQSVSSSGSIPQTHCPRASRRAIAGVWRRVRRSPNGTDALHTAGVLDLLLPTEDDGKSLGRSILTLQAVSRRADVSSGTWVDLSAAYLVRAERNQHPRDLMEAMVAAQQALELDPSNRAGRFNLALALDRYGLDGQAATAWKQYLALDSATGWADEARERMEILDESHAISPPPLAASDAQVRAYAHRDPQGARDYGWNRLLGEWGQAVLKGDTAAAGPRLRHAEALGKVLQDQGGDATLAEAVHMVRAQGGNRSATRTLAAAHAEYAAGQTAYDAVDYAGAYTRFARVLELDPPSPTLRNWTRVFHAMMVAQRGRYAEAERTLRTLEPQIDTVRYPALAGRLRWVLATVLLRTGRYESSLQHARGGAALLERCGERELRGGALYVAADAQYYLGATPAAHEAVHHALSVLRGDHRSVWLLNTLAAAARVAEADGLPVVAARIQDERVSRAAAVGSPRVAEARLARARLRAASGDRAGAAADIDATRRLMDSLPAGPARRWMDAQLRLARVAAVVQTDPASAVMLLNSLLAPTSVPLIAPLRLGAQVSRARARLALKDSSGATADLETASMLIADARDSITASELRASIMDAARGVFDRLVLLQLAAGDTLGALQRLERGRLSFGPKVQGDPSPRETRWELPPGEVAVEYALVADTLLVWTVAGTRVRMVRSTVDRTRLLRSIGDLRLALERGSDGTAERRALEGLYEALVRPVEPHLDSRTATLVLVADGELAGVPFPALYDTRRRRHLVEAYAIRHAGSLRDASRPRMRRHDGAALLVADPTFDPDTHSDLPPLDHARAEVDSIAPFYPRHTLLSDSGASRSALAAMLPRARVVHFAGHAVFDDQRPERSFLVLAPDGRHAGPADMTAGEMERLPLQQVELVVLSACETLRSRNGRSDGFAGFAGALLDAGAGGVVGSLWRVDDRLTTPLMIAFHRAYSRSGDGPRALREAQLRMLRSPDPALRAPAAWAGFRYAGN